MPINGHDPSSQIAFFPSTAHADSSIWTCFFLAYPCPSGSLSGAFGCEAWRP